MRKSTIISLTLILTAGLLWLNGCKKETAVQQQNTTVTDNEANEAMLQHVLNFKQRMEYSYKHPEMRDGESFTAPDAVYELEALLNFNFCYTDIEVNKKRFVNTQITMPLDDMGKIGESKLAQLYYEAIIDSIQARMLSITGFDNMKLLLVDLQQTGTADNGDAIVSIGALVGNEINYTSTDEIGWWFGKAAGNCQGENDPLDATIVLTHDIYFVRFPAPPPGKVRRKVNIITLPEYKPWDYFLVSDDERDNFEDSRLFYAEEDATHNPPLHITDDTRCLSGYFETPSEMTFYRDSYQQFIDSAEIDNNLEFTDCVISWGEAYNNNIQTKIWHTLQITLGHVWLVDEGSVTIDDILAY